MPVYETEINTGKGPRLFASCGQLVAPDALVFSGDKIFWAEVKHKSAFAWYRNAGCWTTGINTRHFDHYIEVSQKTNLEVWLFFLHAGGVAKDSPPSEPGLFCQEIKKLSNSELMRSDKTMMVYWRKESLRNSDIEYWVAVNVRPENQQRVFDLIAQMLAYYALRDREKENISNPMNCKVVKQAIAAHNLIPEGYRLAFSHLLNKAAFDAQEGSTGKGKRRDNFKVLQ